MIVIYTKNNIHPDALKRHHIPGPENVMSPSPDLHAFVMMQFASLVVYYTGSLYYVWKDRYAKRGEPSVITPEEFVERLNRINNPS